MAYAESTVRHQIDSLKGVILCKLKIPSIKITVRHQSASLALPNIYTRDRIFNPHLAAIKDSHNKDIKIHTKMCNVRTFVTHE